MLSRRRSSLAAPVAVATLVGMIGCSGRLGLRWRAYDARPRVGSRAGDRLRPDRDGVVQYRRIGELGERHIAEGLSRIF
jgi:hypothetical protein